MKAAANKSLQVTFDPPPIFAIAKTGVASNGITVTRYQLHQTIDGPGAKDEARLEVLERELSLPLGNYGDTLLIAPN